MEKQRNRPVSSDEAAGAVKEGGATPLVESAMVRRAMSGDKQAFTALFRQTYRMVVMTVRRYLSEEQELYDAVQETYLKAYRHLQGLQTPEAFCAWLRRIARNSALDLLQRRKRDQALFVSFEEKDRLLDNAMDDMSDREVRMDVRALLDGLPAEQEELLVMVYYDGMKLSEIARMQGEPYSTVSSRFQNARKELKRRMQEQGIQRPAYGGGFLAMAATAMRDVVGTNLLSAAVAQQILNAVLEQPEEPRPIDTVTLLMASRRRNAAVLRIAAIVTALSVGASCLTVWLLQRKSPPPSVTAATGETPSAAKPVTESASPDLFGFETTPGGESNGETADTDPEIWKESASGESVESNAAESYAASGTAGEDFSTTTTLFSDQTDGVSGPRNTADTAAVTGDPTSAGTSSSQTGKPATTASQTATQPTQPAFQPDYAPGQANTIGNRADNLTDGFVARQGDWLYYAEGNGYRYLIKIKADGTGKQLLATSETGFLRLNVLGDWIYYTSDGIYRIRTDGSGKELLSTMNAWWLQAVGDDLYFYVEGTGGTIYHMSVSSRKVTTLVNGVGNMSSCHMAVVGDELLYQSAGRLLARSLRTGQTRQLAGSQTWSDTFLLDGTTVYYAAGNRVYTLSCSDPDASPQWTGVEGISSLQNGAKCGNWLIYFGKDDGCRSRHLQSGAAHTLPIPHAYTLYTFSDGYIYYYTDQFRLRRIKPDGSGYQSYD